LVGQPFSVSAIFREALTSLKRGSAIGRPAVTGHREAGDNVVNDAKRRLRERNVACQGLRARLLKEMVVSRNLTY
jgi:hypothetical protein